MRAAAESDGRITDLLYPAKTGCNFASDTNANPWTGTSYVIGIVNRAAAFGSLNYYVVDSNTLSAICAYLMNPDNIITIGNGFDVDEFAKALQLSLVDPIQYIKTCMMIPVDAGDYTNLAGDTQIYCFNWPITNQYGRPLYSRTRIYKSYTFTVPKHPDTNSRGYYVNSAPYTSLKLTIPPYGCIDIDTSVTCPDSNDNVILNVDVEIDPISGKGILVVSCKGIVLNRLESQIGVPISLSQVTRDYIGGITNTVGAIGGIAGGVAGAVGNAAAGNTVGAVGAVAHGASFALSSVGDAAKALMPRAQTVGSTGSFVANRGTFRLDAQFFRPIEDDNTHNGRPLCKMRTLKNLGGYMIIQDGDVPLDATSTEDAKVRAYLESGFYYE